MSRYRIPKQRARIELRVSNSRFVATIAPAFSTQAAQEFIRAIRAELPDASHHVYAFKIGFGASVSEGLSDDGEPSGTAGPPALAVLRGAGIGDVVLVITRYFGGTKLGTGGLVAAYTNAAKSAITALETKEKVTRVRFELSVPYRWLEQVRRLLAEHEGFLDSEEFGAEVRLRYRIPQEAVADFARQLANLTAGQLIATPLDND